MLKFLVGCAATSPPSPRHAIGWRFWASSRYLEDLRNGLVLGKRGRPKKATTISTDVGRIERHIVPLLGNRRVRDLATFGTLQRVLG